MYLIFDATPITKPRDYQAPFSDTFAWPRLIHLSWILLGENLKPIEDYDCVIKPEGFSLSPAIAKYARIDEEELKQKGENLEDVLNQFASSVDKATYTIAHNMNVQEKVVAAEYIRKNIHPNLFSTERVCLMQEATFFAKIPSKRGGYKWPTQSELYALLFNQRYSPAGNARADVIATARSFIMLKKGGKLDDLFEE